MVDLTIKAGNDPEPFRALSDGAFNTTDRHRAFDRGVIDRLNQWDSDVKYTFNTFKSQGRSWADILRETEPLFKRSDRPAPWLNKEIPIEQRLSMADAAINYRDEAIKQLNDRVQHVYATFSYVTGASSIERDTERRVALIFSTRSEADYAHNMLKACSFAFSKPVEAADGK